MRTASGLAMLVVMLLLLSAAGGALKLYMDRQSMAEVIDDYGQTLVALPVGSTEASQAFASAAESARSGRYEEVQSKLHQGAAAARQASEASPAPLPAMPGMPALPGGGAPEVSQMLGPEALQSALAGLPDDARPFFEKRPDLFREALMVSVMARQRAPEEWEPYHDKILKAAAAGDEKQVRALLTEARQKLRLGGAGGAERGNRRGMNPGQRRGPGEGAGPGMPGLPDVSGASAEQLAAIIAQSRQMLERAKAAGLDTGEVEGLVNRADSQLKAGNTKEAAAILRRVFEVVQRAMSRGEAPPGGVTRGPRGGTGGPPGGGRWPRGGTNGRRPGGMRGGMAGGPPGMAPPGAQGPAPEGMFPNVFGLMVREMQEESGVLAAVAGDIDNASLAMREKNQDQIREILAAAHSKIVAIAESRENLTRRLQGAQGVQGPPGGERPGGRGPGRRPGRGFGEQRPGPSQPPGPEAPPVPAVGSALPPNIQRVHDVLGRALDEARGLPPEEYEAQREGFILRLVASLAEAVTGQALSEGMLPESALAPIEVPAEEPTGQAAREKLEFEVRNRLRLIQIPCAKLAEVGVDLDDVGRVIDQARDAVNAGKLVEASQAANQVTDMVWQLLQTHASELQASPTGPPGESTPAPEPAPGPVNP